MCTCFLLSSSVCRLQFGFLFYQITDKSASSDFFMDYYSRVIKFMINQHYLFARDYQQYIKTILLIKKIKKQMTHNYCFSLPSNRQEDAVDCGKVYTQPQQDADATIKFELTPLRNSKVQNTVNKTAKIVKIKCAPKTDLQTQKKMNFSRIQSKTKTQNSHQKGDKTFLKRQQVERFGKLKKNNLKPVVYKSNILLHQQSCSYNKLDMSYTDLLPKSRKNSISFSRHRKNTNQNVIVRQDDARSSKSKKKIQFTVYQSRKKSQCKNQETDQIPQKKPSTLLKHIQSVYNLPYPCTTNIVIDLFHGKSNKRLNTSCGQSKDKSASREKSQKRRRNDSLRKFNQRDPFSGKNPMIENTLLKLKKFQIVNDYANQLEIENLIKGFILAGEPQCKWVLLVIDEVFKKIRSSPNDKL